MKNVQSIQLIEESKEEILPDFTPDFPYIATCAELDKYIEPFTPWHWHRTVELFYIQSGSLEYSTPKGKWVFPAGSGGMVNSNVLHTSSFSNKEQCNIQLLHLFDPVFLSGGHGSRIETKYILPLTAAADAEMIPLYPNDPVQAEILRDIKAAFALSEEEWGYEFTLREALTNIWLKLFALARPVIENSSIRDSDDKIKILMVYIHKHYDEELSIEQLADAAHISRRSCFRLFQDNLHMTPLEYIQSYRLQKACQLLTKSMEPITRVAYSCGFSSGSYFGKLFREHFHCTPLEYRRQWHDRTKNRH